MPTYEYRCPKGHEFERVQKMTDPPRIKCPVCGRQATRMISGGAALIFKGSGFYITDYGKDGKGPRKEKEGEPKPEVASPKSEEAAKPEAPAKSEKPDKPEKKSKKKGSS